MALFTLIFRLAFKCSYTTKRLVRRVLSELVSSQVCLLCGEVSESEALCPRCLDRSLPLVFALSDRTGESRCTKCGKLLISEIGLCTTCRDRSVIEAVDSVFPLYPYRFWTKDLLFLWKSENNRCLSPLFAERIFFVWKERYAGLPLVPVPPRPGKIRKKGWDQIDELSKILEYTYNIPVIRVLSRTEKQQQKQLRLEERLEHKQRYILKKQSSKILKRALYPETVVLLDDVITSGSTLQSCAIELKKTSIKIVYALTLFIVE